MKLRRLGEILNRGKRRHCAGTGFGIFTRRYCNGYQVLRVNKSNRELFWGCSNYPHCLGSAPFIPGLDLPTSLRRCC